MADKKPAGKPAPKPKGGGEGQMVFVALIAVIVMFIIIPTLMTFFGYGDTKIIPDNAGEQVSYAFNSFVEVISFISIFISFMIIMLIVYSKVQYKEITTLYSEKLKNQEEVQNRGPVRAAPVLSVFDQNAAVIPGTGIGLPGSDQPIPAYQPVEPDPRWLQIQSHMASHNQSEWRVAILEADILLYDMLNQMGYPGDSIGEMLKQVDVTSFATLDDAWKAHRIRNTIAHEGANYELTRGEAERAMRMYQRVFEEFYFI
jgi:hypothetical protein